VKTRNYGDAFNSRFNEVFPWVVALDAFDFNDRQPLEELMASEPVPEELRPAIAKIISGERKPNLKAAEKLKIPASERMKIAGSISVCLMLIDTFKYRAIDERYIEKTGVRMYGERFGKEPIEVTRELEQKARSIIENSARELEVSTETIENLLRALRAKMGAYPNV
jgi:hypothetical protein